MKNQRSNDVMGQVPGGLQKGESVKEFFIPSRWRFFVQYGLGILLIFMGIAIGAILAGAGAVFVLLGLGLILLTELYRKGHRYYITNQRLISEITFLGRQVREMTYDLVTNVTFQQTLAARILGIGTVTVQTASGEIFSFSGVSEPDRIKAGIMRQKQAFIEAPKPVVIVGRGKVKYNYCPNCGTKLGAKVNYCPNCGVEIEK